MHRTKRKWSKIKIVQEYSTYHAPNSYTTHSDCRAPKYQTIISVSADLSENIHASAKLDIVHTGSKYH
jgi:hypothetical protein